MSRLCLRPACLRALAGFLVLALVYATVAQASTYVVYIPLDSSIYPELETLNGLGLLDSYLDEIRPISRVEAARLTLEAETRFDEQGAEKSDYAPLARQILRSLRHQLGREIRWLERNQENQQPTMAVPVQRAEVQYLFSSGERRALRTGPQSGVNFNEGTPLMPNNAGIPTDPGSNEVARVQGWAGFGGFLTGYGEGLVAGPFTRGVTGPPGSDSNRLRMLDGEAVVGLGNFALSFGREEMAWGLGHFTQLAQSDNAYPFLAVRLQNIHPIHLHWIFRYLGPFRFQIFFGQLDDDRYFSQPWIDGEIFSFKPLPTFEFGLTHTIMFGGDFNNNYTWMGFLGRATGLSTGSPIGANTNSRGGIYLKFYVPKLRGLQFYTEILGEDNLTKELPPIGRFLPFLAVSYQAGFYLPRLTDDGLTDLRLEFEILEPNYSIHSDSLYWTYDDMLMGDPLGPNASEVDLQLGRWFLKRYRTSLDLFATDRAPGIGTEQFPGGTKEYSMGSAADLWELPLMLGDRYGSLGEVRLRLAAEYVWHINYTNHDSLRTLALLSFSLTPGWSSLIWH